jgi:hypothetical protein
MTAPYAVHGPGTYAHYANATLLANGTILANATPSDDILVYHIWETIPDPAEKNAVFASVQFWFENGVGGYFGTQVWREGALSSDGSRILSNETHRVIFSIWDGTAGSTVGWRGASCGRFGGEGTGSHCIASYPLEAGNAYSLRVRRVGNNGTGDWWAASVTDVKGGTAPLDFGELFLPDHVAVSRSPHLGRQGFGRLQVKAAAFQEYFEATGCANQPLTSVGLVGPWFHGGRVAPAQAYADYAPQCQFSDVGACIYGAGCGPLRVLLTAGGTTVRKHANRSEPLWPWPKSKV